MDREIEDRGSGRLFRPIPIPISHPCGVEGVWGWGQGTPRAGFSRLAEGPECVEIYPAVWYIKYLVQIVV